MAFVRHSPKKWFWWALIILIGTFTCLYLAYALKVIPPWDASAYVIEGKSLIQNHSIQYYDVNNAQIGPYFNPMGFDIRAPQNPQPYSVFPPGFSFILALVYGVTGGLGYLYVIPPIMNMFGLLAAAYLGYKLGGWWVSILAVMLIGTSFVVVDMSTQIETDGPSLSILLVSVALYMFGSTSDRKTPVLFSGLCLGLYVLVKFVNVAFALLIIIHALVITKDRKRWIIAGLLSLGILLGVGGMMLYQSQAYGGPLTNAFQAWGDNRFGFPLFSLRYLLFQSPPPWSDFTLNAIVVVILQDMGVWVVFCLIGLMIDRKNPSRLLLASIFLTTIVIYGLSVFTPRQNIRYMLPALVAGYLLAADALARLMFRLNRRVLQGIFVGVVGVACFGSLWGYLPILAQRNAATSNFVNQVVETAQVLPANAVVLAYVSTDTFILYGDLSVLNYRKIAAGSLEIRYGIVVQAIKQLQSTNQPVYLIKDDNDLFNSLYPILGREFILKPISAPLTAYEIQTVSR